MPTRKVPKAFDISATSRSLSLEVILIHVEENHAENYADPKVLAFQHGLFSLLSVYRLRTLVVAFRLVFRLVGRVNKRVKMGKVQVIGKPMQRIFDAH
jgi:hypothetical protein